MKVSARCAVFVTIAGAVTALSSCVAVADGLTRQSNTDPLVVTVAQAQSALPAAAALAPEQLARLAEVATSQRSLVLSCRNCVQVLLHNSAARAADYGTKQAPGVDPLGARWSVSIFVYGSSHGVDGDLTRLIAAERRCRRRGFVSQDGIVWSVRHVGGASVADGAWTGYLSRDAESTTGKQNPLRLTTAYWSRGNVLVEIQQLVSASRSSMTANAWLTAADTLVLGALSRMG